MFYAEKINMQTLIHIQIYFLFIIVFRLRLYFRPFIGKIWLTRMQPVSIKTQHETDPQTKKLVNPTKFEQQREK